MKVKVECIKSVLSHKQICDSGQAISKNYIYFEKATLWSNDGNISKTILTSDIKTISFTV